MQPIKRNVLLEIQDQAGEYDGGFLRPESYRRISGKLKFVTCATDCSAEVQSIKPGAEVLLDYDSDQIEPNIWERNGRRFFIIRQSFIMGYFDA